jgi:hypothetical protein
MFDIDPELAELEAEFNRNGLSLNLTDETASQSAGHQIITAASISEEIFAQANKNTERAYNSALKPLLHWLENNTQYTGLGRMAINEEKLLVYLRTCVVGRESKKSKGKIIGIKSIQNVVSAAVNLWTRQVMAKVSFNYY